MDCSHTDTKNASRPPRPQLKQQRMFYLNNKSLTQNWLVDIGSESCVAWGRATGTVTSIVKRLECSKRPPHTCLLRLYFPWLYQYFRPSGKQTAMSFGTNPLLTSLSNCPPFERNVTNLHFQMLSCIRTTIKEACGEGRKSKEPQVEGRVRELTISGDLNEVGETTYKLPSSEIVFWGSSPSRFTTRQKTCLVVLPNMF